MYRSGFKSIVEHHMISYWRSLDTLWGLQIWSFRGFHSSTQLITRTRNIFTPKVISNAWKWFENQCLIIIENYAEGQWIHHGVSKYDPFGISKQVMTRSMYYFDTKKSFLMQGSDLNQIFDHHRKPCRRSINSPRGLQIWIRYF